MKIQQKQRQMQIQMQMHRERPSSHDEDRWTNVEAHIIIVPLNNFGLYLVIGISVIQILKFLA